MSGTIACSTSLKTCSNAERTKSETRNVLDKTCIKTLTYKSGQFSRLIMMSENKQTGDDRGGSGGETLGYMRQFARLLASKANLEALKQTKSKG